MRGMLFFFNRCRYCSKRNLPNILCLRKISIYSFPVILILFSNQRFNEGFLIYFIWKTFAVSQQPRCQERLSQADGVLSMSFYVLNSILLSLFEGNWPIKPQYSPWSFKLISFNTIGSNCLTSALVLLHAPKSHQQ